MNYKYKFSIVMPTYNVQEFIDVAVQSVIKQDIGIKNIQLILVDDGAKDNSGEICDKYAAMYPDNIFVVHKPNGGLSSARNAGLELVEGKYVNFMDPDDHIPSNCLSEVWKFFEAHYDETDVTAIKIIYFDGKTGDHYLNYKFPKRNKVINLKEIWDCPHMHVASGFFKKECVENLRFDTRISFAEDGLFSQTVIMDKQTIGLVSSTQYDYRIRTAGENSLIQGAAANPKWYTPTVKHYHLGLINMALERLGEIPKYLQMVVMYELQWRFKRKELSTGVLTRDEEKEYFNLVCEVLKYIDDDVIEQQHYIHRDIKLFALYLKHGRIPDVVETEEDTIFQYSSDVQFYLSETKVYYDFIEIDDSNLIVDGYTVLPALIDGDFSISVLVNGESVVFEKSTKNAIEISLEHELQKNYAFKTVIPLDKSKKRYNIQIAANLNGKSVILQRYACRNYVHFDHRMSKSYMYKCGWKIYGHKKSGQIKVKRCGFIGHLFAEVAFLCQLLLSKKFRKSALYRVFYFLCNAFKRKPVWVISDRATQTGDNGEALFEYLLREHPEIDAWYVLSKQCPDYKRIEKTGKLLTRDTHQHKLKILLSDFILSSHAENEIFNPFASYFIAYKDILCEKKKIFLQHGITKNDVSDWLNKYSKNFSGFVCAAKPEHESIINGKYHYTKDKVWLTGFPRFDKLEDKSEKRIVIMPTWRKFLCSKWNKDTDVWMLLPGFTESDFYKFYNNLLNSEKLINAAKKHGYSIDFFPHPNLQPHIDLFDKNEFVNFIKKDTSYTTIYNRSSLILTDYSSAAFDFAYLRKPLVYTHFDEEKFFDGSHVCEKGYFDDERDGFGEVEYTLEATIDRLVEYIENGCQLKDKYRQRIDNFFAFNDTNNCKRVYEKVINLNKK